MVQAPSRRDRLRAATTQEIIQTARRLLVQRGPEAVSLRAIAREMGMTAPALYRYFGSHEELLRHVVADIFTDLATHVRTAMHGSRASPRRPDRSRGHGLEADRGCREFRAWTLDHVPEFSMIFGSPSPAWNLHEMNRDPTVDCGYQFGQVFLDVFGDLYRRRPFSIPVDEDIHRRWASNWPDIASCCTDLPLGALQTFLRAGCCSTGR